MRGEAKLFHDRTAALALPFVAVLVVRSGTASMLQPGGHMYRALSSSISSDVCPSETSACFADGGCTSCWDAYGSAMEGCFESMTDTTCDDFQTLLCCGAGDCWDNGLFANLHDCGIVASLESTYCENLSLSECSSDGGNAVVSGSDDDTAIDPTSDISAGTATTTTSSESACVVAAGACRVDAACTACLSSYDTAYEDCYTSIISEYSCDEGEAVKCCAAEGCKENELFGAFIGCHEDQICGAFAFEDCVADGSRSITGSDDLTTSTDPPSDVMPTTTSSTGDATSESAQEDDGGSSLAAGEDNGGDDDEGDSVASPATDDGDGEDAEDANASNNSGPSATPSSFVFGRGAVIAAVAMLVTASAATNPGWDLLK